MEAEARRTMPIRRNDSDSFPGAASAFVPPVTSADCCLFSTVQEMAEEAAAAGWPYTVKGGQVFVDASLVQIGTVCFIGEPTISGLVPDPLIVNPWVVNGTNYGSVQGEVWLGNASTWAGSGIRVEQNVAAWGGAAINMNPPVQDGLPAAPAHVYVYVINDCGERNAAGFETECSWP